MALIQIWRGSAKFRLGMIITLILVIVALLHNVLIRQIIGNNDPMQTGSYGLFVSPNRHHLLGTDRYGRDVLALVLVGLPNSLLVAVVAGVISTVIGVVVGFVAGYKGGVTDGVLRTITDMFLVIPSLPLLIILTAYSTHLSITDLALILALFSWPFAARVIRSQVLSLRERPYVELSKMTNMSDWEIISQDITPNMLPYIGMSLAISAVGSAFALVSLTVIGLGPSNTVDLGAMINFGIQWGVLSLGKWAIVVAPMLLLIVLFLGFALINLGLEEFYNPRLRTASEQ